MYYPVSPDPALAAAQKASGKPPAGQPYGIQVPGSKRPGYTAVYRRFDVGVGPLPRTADPEVTTMFQAFEAAVRKYPNNKCLGWREQDKATKKWGPFVWMDYKTMHSRKNNLGSGLMYLNRKHGVTADKFPNGIWSQNRPEWQIADFACMSQACWSVSIYDTLGPETAEYIINHGELVTVIASLKHISTLLSIKHKVPTLKVIISMDPLDDGEAPGHSKKALLSAWAAEKGVEIYEMTEVEELGRQHPRTMVAPGPDDNITINYTSGTTGNPKGVQLTHRNCIAAATAAARSQMYLTPTDVILSYLPLAHIYARCVENQALWAGAGIGFFHGNMLELLDDIKELRPNTFISVPRLYNKIANAIKEATIEQPGVKGALSRHVVSVKMEQMKNGGTNQHAFYDRIWSNKVRAAMGFDRCRGMVSGSAPIAPEVLLFLRAVFSNDFIEGYGLTETYAVALGQSKQDNSAGNCGAPAPTLEVKLRDVPDMGYTSTDSPRPRGELLIRGHTVFAGYYKSPEQTAAAIDADGWFATGDICSIDDTGRFSIVDRVKNLLKLAQGEYVSPEKIENVYLANMPIFVQGLIHGDSFQTYLVAVMGVDRVAFAKFAGGVLKKAIDPLDTAAVIEACGNKQVRVALLKEMDRVGKSAKMAGFERVKNIHLCLDPFTIENDLLTPTLKMKRPPAVKVYKEVIDKLYEERNAEAPEKAKL
ncbi:hypothetical protein EDC01DRAFT_174288 [Geopyxis carbonaria]|nr:hypothetical protein EDC01DRAFT_174288 [Geopyxis carbonaria]